MTREELKELLPIMQAFAEGKVIEFFDDVKGWMEMKNPEFNLSSGFYRIKTEPKYRQFETKEECWNEMLKHQPFGWIKDRDSDKTFIGSINSDNSIFICSSEILFLKELFEDFTFVDGTPFGIKV